MFGTTQLKSVLTRGLSRPWEAEPMVGGAYGEEELEAVVRAIRPSTDPAVGFGFICEEITGFERAFAAYCDTKHVISINGAGGGLDMAMRCSDLEAAAGVHCGSRGPRPPTPQSGPHLHSPLPATGSGRTGAHSHAGRRRMRGSE